MSALGRGRQASSVWAPTALAAASIFVIYLIRNAILPFVIAGGVGFVMDPLIQWLQPRLAGRRWIPALALFILLLVATGALAYWIGTIAVDDAAQLAQNGPAMLHRLLTQLFGPQGVTVFGKSYTADTITQDLQTEFAPVVGPAGYAEGLGLGLATLLGVFLTFVLIPYFLISGPRVVAGTIWLLPPERRAAVHRLLPRIVPVLRRYLIGIAAIVACTAVAAYAGFGLLFALPHAVLLSVAVGFLELIPALGPFTSLVLVGLSSLQQHSIGKAAGLMAYAVALRLVIDNVLGPIVLGRSAQLHPVAIIFAFVVGASLFGILGLLLAVPIAACIVIVLEYYYREPGEPGRVP